MNGARRVLGAQAGSNGIVSRGVSREVSDCRSLRSGRSGSRQVERKERRRGPWRSGDNKGRGGGI